MVFELTTLTNISIESLYFLVAVFQCCFFAIAAVLLVVRVVKKLNKHVLSTEEKLEEERKQRINGEVFVVSNVSTGLTNIGSKMSRESTNGLLTKCTKNLRK